MGNWTPTAQTYGAGYWRVRVGTKKNGKPDYKSFGKDKEAAEAFARHQLVVAKTDNRIDLGKLTQEPQKDIAWALATCRDYGITLKEAVEGFIKLNYPAAGIKTTEELVDFFLESREARGVRQTTMRRYKDRFGQIAKYFGSKPAHTITQKDFLDFFETVTVGCNDQTSIRDFNLYRMFFRWCAKNRYIPLDSLVTELEPRRNKDHTPKLATPEEASHLLYWLCERAESLRNRKDSARTKSTYGTVAHICLTMFAGFRRSEAVSITWDHINFKRKRVTVDADPAKKGVSRKNTDLSENFWFWMAFLKKKEAFLPGVQKRRRADERVPDMSRRMEGLIEDYRQWHMERNKPIPRIVETYDVKNRSGKTSRRSRYQNIYRHSFITYDVELNSDIRRTARLAGNSVRQIEGTYEEVVDDKNDAKAWFAIYPPEAVDTAMLDTEQMDIDAAVSYELRIRNILQAAKTSKEAAEAKFGWSRKLSSFYARDTEALHRVAKILEWEHDDTVLYGDGTDPIAFKIS